METIYFWHEYPTSSTTKYQQHVFSQWYNKEFIGIKYVYDIDNIDYDKFIKDKRFATREQFMMYCKAILFGDYTIAEKILQEKNPKMVKNLGRKIKNFDDEVWSSWKYKIVVNGNYLQFSQNKELKKLLLNTVNIELVEASPYDAIWGIGLSVTKAKQTPKNKWGENLLGKALMETRELLNK